MWVEQEARRRKGTFHLGPAPGRGLYACNFMPAWHGSVKRATTSSFYTPGDLGSSRGAVCPGMPMGRPACGRSGSPSGAHASPGFCCLPKNVKGRVILKTSGLPGTHPGERCHQQSHCGSRLPLLPGPGRRGAWPLTVPLCPAGHHQGGTSRHPGFPRAGHGDGRPLAPEVSRAPSRAPGTSPGERRRLRAAPGAP